MTEYNLRGSILDMQSALEARKIQDVRSKIAVMYFDTDATVRRIVAHCDELLKSREYEELFSYLVDTYGYVCLSQLSA